MFSSKEEQFDYIKENYPEVTDKRIDGSHWDIYCPKCKKTCGFQLVTTITNMDKDPYYGSFDTDCYAPVALYFRCPICKTYKQWIIYKFSIRNDKKIFEHHFFKVTSLPSEGIEDIDAIPSDPPSLRIAYKQAIRSMDANAHIAAAAMFRRALQVITREILGATPGNLANELKEVVGKKYNGGVVSQDFSDIGYIVKEAGNQGAHPDEDPDLLEFTAQDAEDLQKIFMEIISDLFIIPEAVKKSKEEFLNRRKIKS
ncbi:MAG: DUF4145 domain-containing protein [Candidatus Paceibacterota bacterium]